MIDVNASVNDIDGGAFSSTGIVGIFLEPRRSPVAVRNTVKSPWRADANGEVVGGHFHIFLNISHLFQVSIMGVYSNWIAN